MRAVTSERRTVDAIERSVLIGRRVAGGAEADASLRDQIAEVKAAADFSDRESLAIEETAWEQVRAEGIEPTQVFAHPGVLKAVPEASLHYRGLALLSLKRVSEIAVGVENWERPSATPRLTDENVLKVCRLYNAVISSLITDKTDWTMENGYRNVLATIGITADGSMRNLIGQLGENAVKNRMFDWVRTNGLLTGGEAPPDQSEPRGSWALKGGVRMIFQSEPDISFERDGALVALIEVKAGKDPAGALERLGAIKKTFDEAPAACKNFLVVGIVTEEMRTRLADMRMERDFDLDRLLCQQRSDSDPGQRSDVDPLRRHDRC